MAQPDRTRTITQGMACLALLSASTASIAHEPDHRAARQGGHATHAVSHPSTGAPHPPTVPVAAREPARPRILAGPHAAPPHVAGQAARPADHLAANVQGYAAVRPAPRTGASGYAPAGRAAGWNTGWRSDRRYDWAGWRALHRDTFRIGYYYPPSGDYAYARLEVGALLAAEFWREQYWITDPAVYHLPPPWGTYRWVRYYNDCLLVDIDTGEVVDVATNVFW